MRKAILTLAIALLAIPVAALAQETKQEPKQQSVAEAARRAREAKKNAPKASKVFTTDQVKGMSGKGGVSVIGGAAPAQQPGKAEGGEKAEGEMTPAEDEAAWRKRFAEAREKVRTAERELDILQRELNLMSQQYYSDPSQAMKEQNERKEINEHRTKIETKQREVEAGKKAIVDMEDELRKAGKPAAWARE